jgi:hypothetical protein
MMLNRKQIAVIFKLIENRTGIGRSDARFGGSLRQILQHKRDFKAHDRTCVTLQTPFFAQSLRHAVLDRARGFRGHATTNSSSRHQQ